MGPAKMSRAKPLSQGERNWTYERLQHARFSGVVGAVDQRDWP